MALVSHRKGLRKQQGIIPNHQMTLSKRKKGVIEYEEAERQEEIKKVANT